MAWRRLAAALLLAAPAARAVAIACPDWCESFVCDGSAWCQNGEKPSPCGACAKLSGAKAAIRWEFTIPPYVGAGNEFEAENKCIEHGGHLASVANQQENKELLALMLKYKRDRALLGASRNGNTWTWVDHKSWTFQNWAGGQPDNPYEQCVEMWTTGEWNDIPCDQGPRPYFCSVPVPAEDFTFPCSPSIARKIGGTPTCRYKISAFDANEKRDIYWDVAKDRCHAIGGGAQLAEPRTPDHIQFLASGTELMS